MCNQILNRNTNELNKVNYKKNRCEMSMNKFQVSQKLTAPSISFTLFNSSYTLTKTHARATLSLRQPFHSKQSPTDKPQLPLNRSKINWPRRCFEYEFNLLISFPSLFLVHLKFRFDSVHSVIHSFEQFLSLAFLYTTRTELFYEIAVFLLRHLSRILHSTMKRSQLGLRAPELLVR